MSETLQQLRTTLIIYQKCARNAIRLRYYCPMIHLQTRQFGMYSLPAGTIRHSKGWLGQGLQDVLKFHIVLECRVRQGKAVLAMALSQEQ